MAPYRNQPRRNPCFKGPAAAPLIALITAILLSAPTPARAGGAGGTSATVQDFLNGVCGLSFVNISAANCPKLPTINQVVVELSALTGQTPDVIRGPSNLNFNTPAGTVFDAGSLAGLANPLAFIASPGQQPTPTSPSNPAANSFLSATTTPSNGSPTTLNLAFDFEPRTNSTFTASQNVGDIMLPMVVADISQNLVRHVAATLQILATGVGDGVTTDIIGDFLGTGTPQTDPLSALGMANSLDFAKGYLEFDLGIPLLITSDVAPAYLISAAGFNFDPTGGLFDGINPIATFQDASFVNNAGDLLNSVHADLAIAYDGSTVLSDPAPAPEPATIALLGGGLAGLAWLRRRRRKAG